MLKFGVETVIERLKKVHGDRVLLVKETYKGMGKKALFVDEDYGEWWGYPNNVINKGTGHQCRSAAIRAEKFRNTLEDCHELARSMGGKFLSTKYTRSKAKYLWECEKGHRWEAQYSNVKYGKWCPECALDKQRGKPLSEETKKKISEANSGEKNGMFGKTHTPEAKKKISEKSKELWGEDWFRDLILNNPKRKEWCRKGALARLEENKDERYFNTKPEKEFKKILDKNNMKYIHGYSVWDIEHCYQADFYIPKYNLIVEVDGLYWHNYPDGTVLDEMRTKEMKEKGYNVVRIWENEIEEDIFWLKVDTMLNDPNYYDELEKAGL